MSLLSALQVVLAKVESSYGVDATPAGTDAVLVQNVRLEWPTVVHDRPLVSASLSPFKPIHGRKLGRVSFEVELKGSGTAGTAPDWGPLLKACRFAETVSGGVSVTYKPGTSSPVSITLYVYQNGQLYVFLGAVGTVVFRLNAGAPPMLAFTFTGHAVDKADASMATATVDSTVPGVCIGTSFLIDSYAAVVSSTEIDMQNRIITPDSIAAADGYGEFQVSGRNPVMNFDPEAVLVATKDFWSLWEDGTQVAWSMAVNNGAGNIATFSAPKVTFRELSQSERDGSIIEPLTATLARSTADDELSLVMT